MERFFVFSRRSAGAKRMKRQRTDHLPASPPLIRCAIYTRKSTEEGMDQEFNSLVAQRQAAEAFILSQREQGWRVVADPYYDPGFSGGNIERPALKRLLSDVETRRLHCLVACQPDRRTRSPLSFATLFAHPD